MIELKNSPVVFHEESHTYTLGDKELSGVTSTLIHRAFPDKYKDVDPEVLAEAARKGHELHRAIEFFDTFGGDPEEADDDRVRLYAKMKEEYGMTTVANEYLVSDEEHYASSIDIVMLDANEEICLVDIKTTYNLDKQSTALQLSIYKRFFERQNPGLHVKAIYVLWLPNRDHAMCTLTKLSVVADETIDALIEADLNNEPFQFDLIPDEWDMLERQYIFYNERKVDVERKLGDIKDRMMQVMEQANISTVRTDRLTTSYMPEKTTKRFDSAAFKRENASLYDFYLRDAKSAAQIRITPKRQEE